ncbi:DUF397 domain-containing protein [Actinomadura sp. LOL_016]|uniref:DUF397 domain-containing protein n=1 Tax=unclassified Actinomadura TaxID=2626254 RepID=UPI003A80037F
MDQSGATWRKSSYSGPNGGNCVELASLPGAVGVRDSEDPDGPVLVLAPAVLAAAVRPLLTSRSGRDRGRPRSS